MESLFLDLIRILRQQNNILAELLGASEEHNQALRKNDPDAILSTAYKQEELVKKLKRQDGKLEEAKRQLAGEYGMDEKAVLSGFVRHASGPLAAELEKFSQSLKEKLLRLSEINSLNGALARQGRVFTERLSRIVAPKSGNTYMGSGRLKKESKALSIFDTTI